MRECLRELLADPACDFAVFCRVLVRAMYAFSGPELRRVAIGLVNLLGEGARGR